MKLLPLLLLFSLFIGFSACKPAEPKMEEPIPASDFQVMAVWAPVADFTHFRNYYMADDSIRQANMMQTLVIGRGIDDTTRVLVSLRLGDVEKAKAFAASDDLKMRMDSAGVNGPPDIRFVNVIRFDTVPSDAKTRLIIRHKVKDFDAWLAVYDREGPSTRASHGIKDRGMGRAIDDPNMVSLVFDITDIEKAKARAGSEELKALMEEAGVEGAPTAFWYTVVDQF